MLKIPSEQHHNTLKLEVNFLRYLGLWQIDPDSSATAKCLYFVYNKIVIGMICIFIATLFVDLLGGDDLRIVTDDGCILAGILIIFFKLINFQISRVKIQDLIDGIDDYIRFLYKSADPTHLKIIERYMLREKLALYGFKCIGIFLIFGLMFFVPTKDGALPIRSCYPFDTTKTPFHQMAFMFQGIVVTIAMFSIIAMDNIVCILCSQSFCQFEILRMNFTKYGAIAKIDSGEEADDLSDSCKTNSIHGSITNTFTRDIVYRIDFSMDRKMENSRDFCRDDKVISEQQNARNEKLIASDEPEENSFKDNFVKCIKHHQNLIKLVDNLNLLFSSSMFIQMLASTLMICLTGFQAISVVEQDSSFDSSFAKFAIYLGAAFSQLLYWCWCGNELIYQSLLVAEAVWNCGWENQASSSITHLVIFALMRSKKPLKLTAGKFYVMSMESFISVLRGSYSYFTLLNKMNESND